MGILLQINVEVNFGSTGRIAEDIGKLAIKDGWESHIAYGRKKRNSDSNLIQIGNKWNHLYHVLQTRLFDRHGLASKRSTHVFIKKIKKLNPSVIHLHNIHGYYINYKLLFEFLATTDIPVVWTFHDCWALTGHCTHFVEVGCEKWMTQCQNCPQLNVYPSSWGSDRSKKNHSLKKQLFPKPKNLNIISVSNWLGSIVERSYLSKNFTKTIPNGIDVKVFSPKKDLRAVLKNFEIEDKFIILGVASVWSENKGLGDFVNLSKLLNKDERIVLIGLTKKQIQLLPDNIIGLERTESVEGLAQWYSAANVFVNTSVEESFGLTNAEALACGTPIIVYDTTASPEMVIPEVGFVSEKRNIKLLYEYILKVKQKGKFSYSIACRARAEKLYDKDKTFPQYIELYNNLVAKKNRLKS